MLVLPSGKKMRRTAWNGPVLESNIKCFEWKINRANLRWWATDPFSRRDSGKGDKSDTRDRTSQKNPVLVKARLSFKEDSSNFSCSNFRSFLKFKLRHKASFTADEEMLFTQLSAADDEHSADSSTFKRGSLAYIISRSFHRISAPFRYIPFDHNKTIQQNWSNEPRFCEIYANVCRNFARRKCLINERCCGKTSLSKGEWNTGIWPKKNEITHGNATHSRWTKISRHFFHLDRCWRHRQQLFFAGKAYLKINSLVKTPLHEFMAVARSGLWAPVLGKLFLLVSINPSSI